MVFGVLIAECELFWTIFSMSLAKTHHCRYRHSHHSHMGIMWRSESMAHPRHMCRYGSGPNRHNLRDSLPALIEMWVLSADSSKFSEMNVIWECACQLPSETRHSLLDVELNPVPLSHLQSSWWSLSRKAVSLKDYSDEWTIDKCLFLQL